MTAIHFSLGLVPLPITSSSRQVPHGSGNSSILESPRQFRLHLHSFTQWPSFGDTPESCLVSESSLRLGGKFYNPFLLNSTAMWPKLPGSAAYWGCDMPLSFNYIFTNFLLSMISSLPKFGCTETGSVVQADLEFRDLSITLHQLCFNGYFHSLSLTVLELTL